MLFFYGQRTLVWIRLDIPSTPLVVVLFDFLCMHAYSAKCALPSHSIAVHQSGVVPSVKPSPQGGVRQGRQQDQYSIQTRSYWIPYHRTHAAQRPCTAIIRNSFISRGGLCYFEHGRSEDVPADRCVKILIESTPSPPSHPPHYPSCCEQ